MRQISVPKVENWQNVVEAQGFDFHSLHGIPYWVEDRAYVFTPDEVAKIHHCTDQLYEMCLQLVDNVIANDLFMELRISDEWVPLIRKSWEQRDVSIYGRFDYAYSSDGSLKLLEFNADTPTMLMESAVIQYYWMKRYKPFLLGHVDQFNSIHENLIRAWTVYKNRLGDSAHEKVYFCCMKDYIEDLKNVEYICDCARHAGLSVELIYIEDIGWDGHQFVDLQGQPIRNLFKLYPWEMMTMDDFGKNLLSHDGLQIVEPAWKMILSNKGILPLLWDMYPDHPNLLPASFDEGVIPRPFVRKPLLSREGANVTIALKDEIVSSEGRYGNGDFIYQAFAPLSKFGSGYAMLGSWIAGGRSCGIGIRESSSLITDNVSRFVPHFISERYT